MKTSPAITREQALSNAVEDHGEKLFSIIARRLRDHAEAQDVFQEVFEEYAETYDLGTAIDSLGAWLVRVAQNKIVDRFRRRKTENDHREATHEGDEATAIAASPASPEEEHVRSWLRDEILDALEALPEEQFEVFVMHELEGKSFEEISRETGVGINTLLSRKRYAIQSLRDHLKEVYDELG